MKYPGLLGRAVGVVVLLALLASCAPAATQAPTTAPEMGATSAPTQAAPAATATMGQAQDVVTWWEFDQNNKDPKADEHVGNFALAEAIPRFNEKFAGQWNWVNVPKAFDQKDAELIAAVQAGGEVPDAYEVADGVASFYTHGTLQDITDWAQSQSWFKDIDPSTLTVCTGPDGQLYCVPITDRPQLVYVWNDRYPNGFPKSQEEFMTQAAALKDQGFYALTFFGSTDKNGQGVYRGLGTIEQSFGGRVDDGNGHMLLDTPENVAFIQFVRDIVAKGYVPEIAFAGGFQEEEAFKDSSAGAFPTGADGYVFLNPLTAPDGTKYDQGNENDFLNAVADGEIYLSPFFSGVEGQKPGCHIAGTGVGIPVGANNVEGAKAYINWLMSPEENPQFVAGIGSAPALTTSLSDPAFQTPYFEQLKKVNSEQSCRPWYGSLEDSATARPIIMNAWYQLIKQDPTADIHQVLSQAQDQYNSSH